MLCKFLLMLQRHSYIPITYSTLSTSFIPSPFIECMYHLQYNMILTAIYAGDQDYLSTYHTPSIIHATCSAILVIVYTFLLHSPPLHFTHTSSHSTISEAMRLVTDPADFLATPYRFLFNSTLVTDTLNYLSPNNSVVFIGTQKLNFNGSSHPTVTQESPEPVPWPVLTQVCAVHSFEDT